MKLFGSFKLTDRIRIGASSGGGKKKSGGAGVGCMSIFLLLVVICIPISLVRSCINGDEETTTEALSSAIEELRFSYDEYELEIGEDKRSYVRVSGTENFTGDDFKFISTNTDVVTFEFDKIQLDKYLYFYITGISEGTAEIYVETADGKKVSEKISVIVTAPETTTEKETTTEYEEVTIPKFTGRIVYKTPEGERYHYDKECAGNNARELHLDEAQYWGYKPCGTCVD